MLGCGLRAREWISYRVDAPEAYQDLFLLATLSMGQMLWAIAWKWRSLTGGDDGLTGWSARVITVPWVGAFSLSHVTFLYLPGLQPSSQFVSCFAGISRRHLLGARLPASSRMPTGRISWASTSLSEADAFHGCRNDAGVSGSLFILFKKMASPNFLDLFMSFDIVVISVIGGFRISSVHSRFLCLCLHG